MQQGELVAGSVVQRTSRVMVNGVQRPHRSWDVGRELAGDLPEQVSMMSGITAATGSIAWARETAVSGRPLTPFGDPAGWLPGKGDRVEIWEGDGTSEWRVFTGLIDSTTGDTDDSPVSRIVDDIDKLEARFSHVPLQRVMPPRYRAASAYRGIGLTHLYFVDAALRAAGFFALPPAEARQAVSVPAQSSMWPEVGTLVSGTVGGTNAGSWAVTSDGPDGVSISNVVASYSPRIVLAYGEPVRLSMTVAPDHAGTTTMLATWGSEQVTLAVAGSRTVVARLNGTEVCRVVMGDAVRVSLHIDGTSWELRTDTGATASGAAGSPSSSRLSLVTISADPDSRVAGFHVCFTSGSTRWLYTDHVPTARYDLSDQSLRGIMDAAPGIEPTTVSALLADISASTLSAMWIDELGVFQWAPSRSLTGRAPARVLTTAEDILSVPWRDDLQSVRSRTVVKHRLPACTRSLWDNVLWYQGGTESMESGQVANEFITPGADTDWVGDMGPVLHLGASGSGGPASAGWGSMVGGMVSTGDAESSATGVLDVDVSPVTVQTWRVRHTVGSIPSTSKLELRYPEESTTIWPRWWGADLPIIRGFAKTEWADIDTASRDRYRGPAWAPALTHDLGPWINAEDDNTVPQRVADALAVQTRASAPAITGMGTVADPRLQLGDVLDIRSDTYIGARFNALVTGVRNAHDGAASQEVSVRLLSVETTLTTYAAWNTQHAGTLSYDQFAALTNQTYSGFRQDYT